VDASATDAQHTLSLGPDGWLFAHRGWVVTGIQRLPDAAGSPSQASTRRRPGDVRQR
jgi:hypothetical protein